MGSVTTAGRLAQHVYPLAGVIGERNVHKPHALQAAQDHMTRIWEAQSNAVVRLPHQTNSSATSAAASQGPSQGQGEQQGAAMGTAHAQFNPCHLASAAAGGRPRPG
jgi:hypothetical protein